MFNLNIFFLLLTWPGFTKKLRNLKAIWTSKSRCMNRALMVGSLTPPQSLILCVICDGGRWLVKLGFCVYFDVKWGRCRTNQFVLAARRSNAYSMLIERNALDFATASHLENVALHVYCVYRFELLSIDYKEYYEHSRKIESLRITFFVKLI